MALADTVGGDEQVDLFALVGEGGGLLGAALGEGGEVGEDVVEVGATERSSVAAVAADESGVDAKFGASPGGDVLVKIASSVGKGGEDDDLAVGFAVAVDGGCFRLGGDELPELGELAVALGGHGLGFLQEELELGAIVAHGLEPLREF